MADAYVLEWKMRARLVLVIGPPKPSSIGHPRAAAARTTLECRVGFIIYVRRPARGQQQQKHSCARGNQLAKQAFDQNLPGRCRASSRTTPCDRPWCFLITMMVDGSMWAIVSLSVVISSWVNSLLFSGRAPNAPQFGDEKDYRSVRFINFSTEEIL